MEKRSRGKSHGGADGTEGRLRGDVRDSFAFWTNAIHHSHRQMIWWTSQMTSAPPRTDVGSVIGAYLRSLPLCGISSKSSTHGTDLITPDSWSPPNGSSVKRMDAFRIALAEDPRWFPKQKHGQDCQLSILSSSSDTKTFSISIRWKHRQDSEKSLHNLKQIICK